MGKRGYGGGLEMAEQKRERERRRVLAVKRKERREKGARGLPNTTNPNSYFCLISFLFTSHMF
jgi:hypothetical protein